MKLIVTFALLILSSAFAVAQHSLPVIRSTQPVISIEDGKILKKDGWRLAPEAKPDVYQAELIDGVPHKVTFITDVESISFVVEEGKKYDFIVKYDDALCYTQIVGTRFVPAAVFDKAYQDKHRGKTFIEVPEVYELVNVAIALTPTGVSENGLVYKSSDYYTRVRKWFDKFRDHELVAKFEEILKTDQNLYFSLKMNGYSFEFDGKGKIVRSKVYDRTGFSGNRSNLLVQFLPLMQSFADATNFREFYKQNRNTYDAQIGFFRDTADLAEMKRWLDRNFPKSNDYDTYKIIFSPLVAYNQSVTWFESNGFKELQPHVNFPYPQDLKRAGSDFILSPRSEVLFRGNIVFTEMNHGYINPEADKYAERISKAVSNRDFWVDKAKGANYYPGMAAFNEYMNWALVSLRIADHAPKEEQAKMIAAVDKMMTTGRGFPQFQKFDEFLVKLYVNRKAGQTLADLYPQIIEWFEKNNGAAPKAGS